MTRSVALGIVTVVSLGSPIGRIALGVCGHHRMSSLVDLMQSAKPRVVLDQAH